MAHLKKPERCPQKCLLFLLLATGFIHLWLHKKITFTKWQRITSNPQPKPLAWTEVTEDVHVYSAFFENRTGSTPFVKVLGLKRVTNEERMPVWNRKDLPFGDYYCRLFYTNEDGVFVDVASTNLTYFVFQDQSYKYYLGVFYNCYFKTIPITSQFPLYVALYPLYNASYPDKLVQVGARDRRRSYSDHRNRNEKEITVCVRPLFTEFGPWEDIKGLVQFISYYELLGVDSFIFYDLSISARARTILESLPNVKLMSWNFPSGDASEWGEYGGIVALNDCLYQAEGVGFLAVLDQDQFLVLRNDTTLKGLVSETSNGNFDQLVFRSTLFCKERCQTWDHLHTLFIRFHGLEDRRNPLLNFPIFSCTTRTKGALPPISHKKYIVRAKTAVALGHHKGLLFASRGSSWPGAQDGTVTVDPSLAHLNHYRSCSGLKDVSQKSTLVSDKGMLKFEGMLNESPTFKFLRKYL